MFKFFSDKFNNLKQAVSNTAQNLVTNVVEGVGQEEEFSEFVLDDMEDLLISADLGDKLFSRTCRQTTLTRQNQTF